MTAYERQAVLDSCFDDFYHYYCGLPEGLILFIIWKFGVSLTSYVLLVEKLLVVYIVAYSGRRDGSARCPTEMWGQG